MRKLLMLMVAAAVGYAAYLVLIFVPDTLALARLDSRLDPEGEFDPFPYGYFQNRIRPGMCPFEVEAAIQGYDRVDYFVVPVGGSTDSVVMQRFNYPLVWSDLPVIVEYRHARVSDVHFENEILGSGVPLADAAARERLGVGDTRQEGSHTSTPGRIPGT